jgi:hypothetical protein
MAMAIRARTTSATKRIAAMAIRTRREIRTETLLKPRIPLLPPMIPAIQIVINGIIAMVGPNIGIIEDKYKDENRSIKVGEKGIGIPAIMLVTVGELRVRASVGPKIGVKRANGEAVVGSPVTPKKSAGI